LLRKQQIILGVTFLPHLVGNDMIFMHGVLSSLLNCEDSVGFTLYNRRTRCSNWENLFFWKNYN